MSAHTHRQAGRAALVVALALATVSMALLVAATASAQSVCDQYLDLPQCGGPGHTERPYHPHRSGGNSRGGSGNEGSGTHGSGPLGTGPGDGPSGGGPSSGAGGGSHHASGQSGGSSTGTGDVFPLASYPATPLILALLGLVTLGLLIRGYMALRTRVAARRAGGGPGHIGP